MPKVSVIIPTYNTGEFIYESINSVIAQTFKDNEIIVVDDGSTDNTRDKLSIYGDNIRYFFQENQGLSAARNTGIKHSKGEYIAFLDSDDIWLPEKLKWQLEILEKNHNYYLVFTDTEMFDGEKILRKSMVRSNKPCVPHTFDWSVLQREFNDGSIIKDYPLKDLMLYRAALLIGTCALIKKEVFENVGRFDESLMISEDFDMALRIREKYPIIFLNKVLARYRYRENSVSGNMTIRPFRYLEYGSRVLEKFFKKDKKRFWFLGKRLMENYRNAAWGYLYNKDLPKARSIAYKSLGIDIKQPKMFFYIILSLFPIPLIIILFKLKRYKNA